MSKKWMFAVVGLAVVGLFAWSMAQTQIEGYQLRATSTGHGYWALTDALAAQGTTTWNSIDSGAVDTSIAYRIVPGCYVNLSLKVDAATDSLLYVYAYGSQTGLTADGYLLDSMISVGGVTTVKSRTLMGTAAATPVLTAGQPIMFRYVYFIVKADGDAAADTVNVTGWVTTTPAVP